jgi:hypothetical protein
MAADEMGENGHRDAQIILELASPRLTISTVGFPHFWSGASIL